MGKIEFEPVIGLEVHAQLSTESKLFASDANLFGSLDNENISAVSLAHPGTLPMLNENVFPSAIKLGLALNSKITEINYFDRKNYFYPDLPKGYQITQDNSPICVGGSMDLYIDESTINTVHLNRIHIEEDAGKSKHKNGRFSEINYNRAGVPLLEIVTEPCIHDEKTASAFVNEIRKLLRWLSIGGGNMEKGQLRCDVNISLREKGSKTFGTKVEIKNLNSLKNVQRAIKAEVARQTEVLLTGGKIEGNTRDFDDLTGESKALRSKESLNDYRYFPDPDITPFVVDEKLKSKIVEQMPILPGVLFKELIDKGYSKKEAEYLTSDRKIALYYQEACQHTTLHKKVLNWILGPITNHLNESNNDIAKLVVKPKALVSIIAAINEGTITSTQAQQKVFPMMLDHPKKNLDEILKDCGLDVKQDEDLILTTVQKILAENPDKVTAFKKGKKGLLQMFIGQSMRALQGKADAKTIKTIIEKELQ